MVQKEETHKVGTLEEMEHEEEPTKTEEINEEAHNEGVYKRRR